MDREMSVEDVLHAAFEAFTEVFDEDMEAGIALVLGKVLLPDTDSDFQKWIAGLVLKGLMNE